MYTNLYFIVYSVFLIFLCQSYGQEIAEKQCDKYVSEFEKLRTPNAPRRIKRIIGGTKSDPMEFPFMVALGYGDNDNRRWLCGGALISEKFVLTSGVCTSTDINSKRLNLVRLGTTDITVPVGLKPAQDIAVKKIHVHPEFKKIDTKNDIALVELETTVNFSSSVLPACLNTGSSPIDVPVVATGWGRTDSGKQSNDLMKVTLSIYSSEKCKKAYASVASSILKQGIPIETQICAGGKENTRMDTCAGDSGGPLSMQSGAKNIIVGISSFGPSRCGQPNIPGIYTRVSAFIPWLESIVWK